MDEDIDIINVYLWDRKWFCMECKTEAEEEWGQYRCTHCGLVFVWEEDEE